jgi:hypothetical protein
MRRTRKRFWPSSRRTAPWQTLLARRVAAAAWRLLRADGIEAELFAQQGTGNGDLGLALIRDCNGAPSTRCCAIGAGPKPSSGGRFAR